MPIADQIESLFRSAEPRLLRLARSQHVAPDATEDIVQETLLEAWRSLEHLRDEARFDAWLDGICRNVCQRHQRKQGILLTRETPLEATDETPDPLAHIADPSAFDPAEELARHDMTFLLDRALSYLSPANRQVVEQHYLVETPQRELAEKMGMTLSALEARLHRAREQLARILNHDLRAEALALGLMLTPAEAVGWRDTSFWCIFCGKQRTMGIFEPMTDGRVNMRLICPRCQSVEMDTFGIVDLSSARSFLPAAKKAAEAVGRFYAEAFAAGGRCRCWICRQPCQLRIVQDLDFGPFYGVRSWILSDCPCQCIGTANSALLYLPQVREFLFARERVVLGPEVNMEYAGQSAIRFSLIDLLSTQRMYLFAHAETLAPLDVIIE